MARPLLSIVVTAHQEGRLAHHTMRSLFRSVDACQRASEDIEVFVVLDKPDEATRRYFSRYKAPKVQVTEVACGDPSAARNTGVARAEGIYIAFLDADDLVGKMWFSNALKEAEKIDGYFVLHPEYVVCFGRENLVAKPMDVRRADFKPKNLIKYNLWNSVHFVAPRTVLEKIPFREFDSNSGFGYEDWHWHCEVVAEGIPVYVVSETVVFYRKKATGSRLADHDSQGVMMPPSRLFSPEIYCFLGEGMQQAAPGYGKERWAA
jgi:glycosyltransferase involved in cell wall biosynthesis